MKDYQKPQMSVFKINSCSILAASGNTSNESQTSKTEIKYEQNLLPLICPANMLDEDTKFDVDYHGNTCKVVYNLGDKLLKFTWKENSEYIVAYQRNLYGLGMFQLNVTDLIRPLMGSLLKYEDNTDANPISWGILPVNRNDLKAELPSFYNFVYNEELKDHIALFKTDNTIYLRVAVGKLSEQTKMEEILDILVVIVRQLYLSAFDIVHSKKVSNEAQIVAKKYMRCFIRYKNNE